MFLYSLLYFVFVVNEMLDKYIVFQICSIIFNCILIHCQDGTEIYGQVANDRKKYASEVGLIRYNKGSETVYCTGTIINSEWLVTSRHCFQSGTEIGTVCNLNNFCFLTSFSPFTQNYTELFENFHLLKLI